jgi:hypothetical protein
VPSSKTLKKKGIEGFILLSSMQTNTPSQSIIENLLRAIKKLLPTLEIRL